MEVFRVDPYWPLASAQCRLVKIFCNSLTQRRKDSKAQRKRLFPQLAQDTVIKNKRNLLIFYKFVLSERRHTAMLRRMLILCNPGFIRGYFLLIKFYFFFHLKHFCCFFRNQSERRLQLNFS